MNPLVPETDWLSALAALPPWPLPRGPVVLVSPHPDDETLAAGGVLAALAETGASITVVAVTNGERAYSDAPDSILAATRRDEQVAALRHLGIPETRLVQLALPDSDVSPYQDDLTQYLVELLHVLGPAAELIAPSPTDFHPDHEASGRAAAAAAAQTGNSLHSWFWWSWHRKPLAEITAFPLRRFNLHPRWQAAKAAALAQYNSQLGPDAILPDDLLAPARRPFEVFA